VARENWVVGGGVARESSRARRRGVARENWVVNRGVAMGSKCGLSVWLVHVGVLQRTGGMENPRVPGLFHSCPSLSQRLH